MNDGIILNAGPWRDGCQKCKKPCGPNLVIVNGRCNRCGDRDFEHGVPFLESVPLITYTYDPSVA